MKRLLLSVAAVLISVVATAQSENSIVIDQSSFRAIHADALTGVNIDPINLDSSRRECARIKMKINRMTRAEIDAIEVKIKTNNELVKCKSAEYDLGLILEMTALQSSRFYIYHPQFGYSNEVSLRLEGNKEYYIEASLNKTYSIVINSDVAGADVYIDDIFKGRTGDSYTLVVSEILPGSHTLKVVYDSISYLQQIEVNGSSIQFRQNVVAASSKLQVSAQLSGFTSAPYKVGDYYNDGEKEGVVFEVSANGRKGRIVSLKESEKIPYKKISEWPKTLGEGWMIPSIEILKKIATKTPVLDKVNATLSKYGTPITDKRYYSSTIRYESINHIGDSDSFRNFFYYISNYSQGAETRRKTYYDQLPDGFARAVCSFSAPYAVGDYYNDGAKEGVVFEVNADGQSGKIVSMKQSIGHLSWALSAGELKRLIGLGSQSNGANNMATVKKRPKWQIKYPIFSWCADLGDEWYLPSIEEIIKVMQSRAVINRTLVAKGGATIDKEYYISSTEDMKEPNCVYLYHLVANDVVKSAKDSNTNTTIRAIAKF